MSAQRTRSQAELANLPSIFSPTGKVICPNCEKERHINWYVHCQRPKKFAEDLNQVLICARGRGGCGHIFSPGNREMLSLLIAYLEGEIVLRPVEDDDAAAQEKDAEEVNA